jgi:hypothetical protein
VILLHFYTKSAYFRVKIGYFCGFGGYFSSFFFFARFFIAICIQSKHPIFSTKTPFQPPFFAVSYEKSDFRGHFGINFVHFRPFSAEFCTKSANFGHFFTLSNIKNAQKCEKQPFCTQSRLRDHWRWRAERLRSSMWVFFFFFWLSNFFLKKKIGFIFIMKKNTQNHPKITQNR